MNKGLRAISNSQGSSYMEIYSEEKNQFIPITEIKEMEEWHNYEIKFKNPPKLNDKIFSKYKLGNYGVINFQNFVGFTEIEGHRIFVKSRKFNINEFDAMLNYINNKIKNLPFGFDSPTFLPYERVPAASPDILYHNFAFLRFIMCQSDEKDNLESQIRKILYDPYRKLEKERKFLDVHSINKIDDNTICNIISETQYLTGLPENSQLISTTLGKSLTIGHNVYFPHKVDSYALISSFDSPENRFIKYFLKQCEFIVNTFHEYICSQSTEFFYFLDSNLKKDFEYMLNFLRTIQVDTIFSEVGNLRYVPIGSSVLQKKEGYRKILEFYSSLNMITSYNTFEVNLYKVLQNKNIATLYEIWCFFKVKEIIDEIKGKCAKAIGAKFNERYSYLEWELCLEYSDNFKLFYNRAYKKGEESYSLTLRPDITLEIGDEIYLFDAKFRMDKSTVEGLLEDDDTEEKDNSTFKKDDLYKMHTYKDAIKKAISIFILYPGKKEIFFHESDKPIEQLCGFKQIIQEIISTKNYTNGVGVVSLKPLQ